MRRLLTVAAGLMLALDLLASAGSAQWFYPGGYGPYGMAGWGGDPAAAYMTGLGSYARGRGVYELDRAKAQSINTDTAIKWNKALRARQRVLRQDQQREAGQPGARPASAPKTARFVAICRHLRTILRKARRQFCCVDMIQIAISKITVL